MTQVEQCSAECDCTESNVGCRLQKLLQNIMAESQNKTLIFVETKRKADELQRRMQRDGFVLIQQSIAVATAETCFVITALYVNQTVMI